MKSQHSCRTIISFLLDLFHILEYQFYQRAFHRLNLAIDYGFHQEHHHVIDQKE